MCIVLTLQLIHHRIAVLPSPIRRRWPISPRSARRIDTEVLLPSTAR
jgi:hypothetical protein